MTSQENRPRSAHEHAAIYGVERNGNSRPDCLAANRPHPLATADARRTQGAARTAATSNGSTPTSLISGGVGADRPRTAHAGTPRTAHARRSPA